MPLLRHIIACTLTLSLTLVAACQTTPDVVHVQPGVQPAQLGSTDRAHVCQSVLLASQPDVADLDLLQQRGYRSVLNLRGADEDPGFDEGEAVTERGIDYYNVGFSSADQLSDGVFQQVRQILNDQDNHPILVHCASANRVGAVWLAHRVLDHDLDYETALAEARTVGLRSDALEERARDYIFRERGHDLPAVN